jgi:predicted nucleic acid-binding protein
MSSGRSPQVIARGLLDTSVVIALDEIPSDALPEVLLISALTMAELASGPHATNDPIERARRQERLQAAESMLTSIAFDAMAARAFGPVYAATLGHDRKPRGPRTVDLLIASVALAEGLPLFTRNPRDFEHLQSIGLQLYAV